MFLADTRLSTRRDFGLTPLAASSVQNIERSAEFSRKLYGSVSSRAMPLRFLPGP